MKIISIIALFAGGVLASDSFFENVPIRPQFFEKTDLNIPQITVHLSDNDYKRFFLNYQCEYDTSRLGLKRNDECYTEKFIDLHSTLSSTLTRLNINIDDPNDAKIANKYNISLKEFEHIMNKYCNLTLEKALHPDYASFNFNDNTFNGSMTFDISLQKTEISNIKIAPAEMAIPNLSKLSYKIDLLSEDLFGKKSIELRAENGDPSFLREKLIYDICNVAELPTLSANFARLYFNDQYMGIYTMRDTFDKIWAEENYGEIDSNHIYRCSYNNDEGGQEPFYCENIEENLKSSDNNFSKFVEQLKRTKNREELEEFFDVDSFMKWLALRYLIGSGDHAINYRNNYLYMFHNDIIHWDTWFQMVYQFDYEMGSYAHPDPRKSLSDTLNEKHILLDILNIKKDPSVLVPVISEMMKKVFNPKVLFPRIDQLKRIINYHIQEDRTPDANGQRPGRLPRSEIRGEDSYTYEDYQKNSEFTSIKVVKYLNSQKIESENEIYGLKQWILERFQYTCETFSLDCSYAQEYLNQRVQTPPEFIIHEDRKGGCNDTGYECCPAGMEGSYEDESGLWDRVGKIWCIVQDYPKPVTTTTTTIAATTTTTTTTTTSITTTTTTTAATATTTQTPESTQCAAAYKPCGGSRFPNAPHCCVKNYYCETADPTYHQCYPDQSGYEEKIKKSKDHK